LLDQTGTPTGVDKSRGDNITASGRAFYGSTSDVWGTTLTPANVASAAFGIEMSFSWTTGPRANEHDCDIYHIVSSDNPDLFPQIDGPSPFATICFEVAP